MAFSRQLRVRVRARLVRLIRSLLSMEVHGWIARIVRRRRILVLPLKALQAGPCFNQCSIYGEVLVRSQALFLSLVDYMRQKLASHVGVQQAVSVLGEGGGIPDLFVDIHSHEPAEQYAV